MKKFFLVFIMFFLHLQLHAQTVTYEGAWFEVKYPSGFKVKNSLPSETAGQGFDSAFFISPDGEVEFYIFSPQWSGEASDITLKQNEREVSRQVQEGENSTVVFWTIVANNNSYTRTYQETYNHLENTNWVIGIKYKSQKAYDKYREKYLAFKNSLIQYAD